MLSNDANCVQFISPIFSFFPNSSTIYPSLSQGFIYLMNELPQERLLVANMAIASAEACFEWTRSYVKDRKVALLFFVTFVSS